MCRKAKTIWGLGIERSAGAFGEDTKLKPRGGCFVKFFNQCVRCLSPKSQDLNRAIPVHLMLLRLVFLENRVEVASSKAEGRERGSTRMLGPRQPRPHGGIDVKRR